MPVGPATEIRRRLRAVPLFAAVCGLVILGVGIWQFSRPSAVAICRTSAVLSVGGGPGALAITRDGEIWVAVPGAGQIDELAEPMVGARGGDNRRIGRADALVASPHQLIVYADVSGRIISLMSPGMSAWTIMSAPGLPNALAISPDGKTLYVASDGHRDIVRAVSTATGHAGPPISTGHGYAPVTMALSPDGRKLYVANESNDSIVVINTAAWRQAAVITLNRAGRDTGEVSWSYHLYMGWARVGLAG